ncbi:AAA family ATPase [Nonomuraea typhae]|uniref:nSTAND1 domain-containing NTPase n=1 Tax=Nonomuraea typhae TaxID=2603600 RepID=UPI0012FC7532|nr:AAA family ATPase [Nonomuraea typhae]
MTARPRNPFPARGTMSMEEHVRDADILDTEITGPTVRLRAVARLTGLVERYLDEAAARARNSGQAVFLHGEHGSGKTHAIRYALGQTAGRARETGALRLYVKAQDDDFVAVYRRLMSQVGRDRLRELSQRFRGVLAVEQLGARSGTGTEPGLLAAVLDDPDRLSLLYDELLVEPGSVLEAEAGELERVSGNGEEFQRALAALLEPANEEAAYAWFTGRELDPADEERLGVAGPLDDPDRCRYGLQLLTALCTRVGWPIIIIIDQCERPVLGRPANLGLLHSLVERIPQEAGMLVLAGSTAAWQALPDDLRQRFGGSHVDTSVITPGEAGKVLAAYVGNASGVAGFQVAAVNDLLRVSGGNIRILLQLAYRVVEAARAEGGLRLMVGTDLVREVVGAAFITLADVELAVEAWLLDERAAYVRDWRGDGVVADFAVLSDVGPQLLIEVKGPVYTIAQAARLSERFKLLEQARERGWPARVLLIVAGYASPAALSALRRVAHEVVVFAGVHSLDRLRGQARGLEASSLRLGPRAAPYRGLAPFREEDAGIFYGRENEVAALVDRLAERDAGPLIVTGASGAGKSSLLRAGLLSALAGGALGADVARWPQILITPGRTPLSELAVHLSVLSGLDAPTVRQTLLARPQDARLLASQALAADTARRRVPVGELGLILVIDQFEELFTMAEEAERAATVTALHAIATGPGKAHVIISVRADFIDRCADHPELVTALGEGLFVLGPMREIDLRAAIEGPARAAGLAVEPGLVEAILADLRTSSGTYAAGALPLLAMAMFTVWEGRENGRLTVQAYRRSGGVAAGVAQRAEEVLDSLTPEERTTARELFRQLVTVTREGVPMRRVVRRAEVLGDGDFKVVMAFSDARLITLDEETVQISHEILLQTWPRLRAWLAADREQLLRFHQLLDAAAEWEGSGRDPAFLYRGTQLGTVLHDREHVESGEVPGTAKAFVDASMRAHRRGARLRNLIMIALIVLSVVATGSAVVALQESRVAGEQRAEATSRLLAERSASFATDPRLSALLAVAAWRTSPTQEARVSLESVLTRPVTEPSVSARSPVSALAFSPDGRTFVTGTTEGVIRLWDVSTRVSAGSALTDAAGDVSSMAFSPDGSWIAAARGDEVLWWRLKAGQVDRASRTARTLSSAAAHAVAFSPDGRLLAAAGQDGSVHVWDPATGRPSLRLSGSGSPLQSLSFSPDGRMLAGADASGDVSLWDMSGETPRLTRFSGRMDSVLALAFSPDGKALATAGLDGTVWLWDVATSWLLGPPFTGHTAGIETVAFSSDGRTLATGSRDRTVRLWDVVSHRQVGRTLTGFTDSVTSVTYLPDGKTLAAASLDGTVRFWTVPPVTDPVRSACVIADREFTQQEWATYVPDLPYRKVC